MTSTESSNPFSKLTSTQQTQLKRGGISSLDELLRRPPKEIAKKAKISAQQVEELISAACLAAPCPQPRLLKDVRDEGGEMFTTGDSELDRVLGGGIRAGMIWEIAGESAAGKTQFALQLSLFVQLPKQLRGSSGSACYLTTSSKLPTSRLLQIAQHHPLLSSTGCGSDHIHTTPVPTVHALLHVLSHTLPSFIQTKANTARPVRLVVIDALAELFHASDRTTTATLVERSRNIVEVSTLLHTIASTHQIAILVLNEVVDAFSYGAPVQDTSTTDLVYSEQARLFSRADSIPGEGRKEAALGLVWANQVNARIMFSRTGRRRYIDELDVSKGHPVNFSNKRLRLDTPLPQATSVSQPSSPGLASGTESESTTIIRRLSIIFSSVSSPASLDYIVTIAGISTIKTESEEEIRYPLPVSHAVATVNPVAEEVQDSQSSQFAPLDVGSIEAGRQESETEQQALAAGDEDTNGPSADQDEWDQYWEENQLTQAEVDGLQD